jgi:hypothetical protein
LIGEEKPREVTEIRPPESPSVKPDLLEAGVRFLEALAASKGELPWTEELRERATSAMKQLLAATDQG